MVANRKAIDGENELITLTRIYPVWVGPKSLQHMFPDYHVGEGRLYGTLMRLRIYKTDRAKLLAAGYIPADLLTESEVATHIDVYTAWDDTTSWRIGDVIPAAETAHVHTEAERKAAWALDVVKFGKYERVGLTELRFSRLGESVTWGKNAKGEYVRTEGASVKVYEAAVHPDIARLQTAFASAGASPAKPLALVTSGAAKRTRTAAVSIAIVMPKDTRIPAAVWELVEQGAFRNGDFYVVQLKAS